MTFREAQHMTHDDAMQSQEKNITETFLDQYGRTWEAELNIEYDGDDLVSWCHVRITTKHKEMGYATEFCSSLGVVEDFGTVENDRGYDLKVPQQIQNEVREWADENGY